MSVIEREIAEGMQDDMNAGIDQVMAELRAMEDRIDAKLEFLEAKMGYALANDRRSVIR